MNVVPAEVSGGRLAGLLDALPAGIDARAGQRLQVGVRGRPMSRWRPREAPMLTGVVEVVEPMGDESFVHCRVGDVQVVLREEGHSRRQAGEAVDLGGGGGPAAPLRRDQRAAPVNRREALAALAGLGALACQGPATDGPHALARLPGEAAGLEAAIARVTAAHPELAVRPSPSPSTPSSTRSAWPSPTATAPTSSSSPTTAWGTGRPATSWNPWSSSMPPWLRASSRGSLDALVYRGAFYGLPVQDAGPSSRHAAGPRGPRHHRRAGRHGACLRGPGRRALQGIAWELDSLYFHAPYAQFGGQVYADDRDTPALASPRPPPASPSCTGGWRRSASSSRRPPAP
ncbi:MAG: hypothetical protein R3F60_33020 [bacterium]